MKPDEQKVKQPTILVVEDEEPIRRLVVTTLKKEGYTVLEASHPHEAAQIIGSSLFTVNLLVADIIMPNMNGYEFARELLSMRPSLKIIFATGCNQDEMQANLAGMCHSYLSKPYTVEALRDAVKTALAA